MCDIKKIFDAFVNDLSDDGWSHINKLVQYSDYAETEKHGIELTNVLDFIGLSCGNAKKLLKKNFKEDVDYTSLSYKEFGMNKEKIMINFNTMVCMGMMATTEQGRKTRALYAKMQVSIMKSFLVGDNNLLKEQKKKLDKAEDEKTHNTIMKSLQNNNCVYVLKLVLNDDEGCVLLGKTQNIDKDIQLLQQKYTKATLIDGYCVEDYTGLHNYVLHRADVDKHRVVTTEFINISSQFPLQRLLDIIKKNLHYFNNPCDPNTISSKKPTIYHKVYKYTPSNLKEPIQSFMGLCEAARSLGTQTDSHDVRSACINNTILNGFRWYMTDHSDVLPQEIPSTIDIPSQQDTRNHGLVVRIHPSSNIIEGIYNTIKEAADDTNLVACTISKVITGERAYGGYLWRMYNDCDEVLKKSFIGAIPNHVSKTCNKEVLQIDPSTNNIVKIYQRLKDVTHEHRICHKKLRLVASTGDIYKGFKWLIV